MVNALERGIVKFNGKEYKCLCNGFHYHARAYKVRIGSREMRVVLDNPDDWINVRTGFVSGVLSDVKRSRIKGTNRAVIKRHGMCELKLLADPVNLNIHKYVGGETIYIVRRRKGYTFGYECKFLHVRDRKVHAVVQRYFDIAEKHRANSIDVFKPGAPIVARLKCCFVYDENNTPMYFTDPLGFPVAAPAVRDCYVSESKRKPIVFKDSIRVQDLRPGDIFFGAKYHNGEQWHYRCRFISHNRHVVRGFISYVYQPYMPTEQQHQYYVNRRISFKSTDCYMYGCYGADTEPKAHFFTHGGYLEPFFNTLPKKEKQLMHRYKQNFLKSFKK